MVLDIIFNASITYDWSVPTGGSVLRHVGGLTRPPSPCSQVSRPDDVLRPPRAVGRTSGSRPVLARARHVHFQARPKNSSGVRVTEQIQCEAVAGAKAAEWDALAAR